MKWLVWNTVSYHGALREFFENTRADMKPVQRVLIDMDGVLCDFTGGMCQAHAMKSPYGEGSKHLGNPDIDVIWGMRPAEFWRPANKWQFWAGLQILPLAKQLVQLLIDLYGIENLCLLSTPSRAPDSMIGKLAWIQQHFPEFTRRYLFGPQKHFCARPDTLLIDDLDKNVEAFRRWDGRALLFPQPWNVLHYEADVMGYMSTYLPLMKTGPIEGD